ncbi:MAG: substrate-binding domain-containing protein [Opitutus sp.]
MNPHTRHHVRSITVLGWTVGLVSLILAGCSGESPPARPLSGEVTIKGSNTFGEELAPRLIAAYRRQQPNVSVNLESKGSASGIAALLDGTCDIAATSRGATDQELSQAHARGIDLNQYVIGYYGVAVIVSEANPVDRLTEEQVKAIFTGSIRNWREVGGLNLPIHVAIRNPVSGTHRGFRQLAMDNAPYLTEA